MRVADVTAQAKDLRPKRRSATRQPAKMSDATFAANYPKAWQLFSYFDKMIRDKGFLHIGKYRTRSKMEALRAFKENPNLDTVGLKACIRWSFTPEKEELEWYGSLPVNHLGTIFTLYNVWYRTVYSRRKKSAPTSRDDLRRRHVKRVVTATNKQSKILRSE
jgi:hypothetical protein